MNYTELKANIQDIVESSFTDEQLALFVQQAEQKIYNFVNIPALRKNVTGTLTNGNKYLALPTDFLYSYSLAVVDTNGAYNFLLQKDDCVILVFMNRELRLPVFFSIYC